MALPAEVLAEMRRLILVEGWRIGTVARKFGCHHSVVRRAVQSAVRPLQKPAPSKLDEHKPYIVERLAKYPELTGVRLVEEVRERGYDGGIATLRRFVMQVRKRPVRKAYLRVEFEPGEQGQVDWGSFGHLRVGHTKRAVSGFVMVLSWSRMLFVDFAFDQKLDTFLRLHREALQYFGGTPRRVVYDNLKSVVLHHIGRMVQFNPNFLPFAGHYLFEPVAAPVRYPEFKGRVEHGVRYIRQSFYYGRSFRDLEDLRAQARSWMDEVANVRRHKTTQERPVDRLLIEKKRLIALPERPFDTDKVEVRVVRKDARVPFDSNQYSVPYTAVGKTLFARADGQEVRFVDGTEVIASHTRSYERGQVIEDPKHTAALLERRKSARPMRRRDYLAGLSAEAAAYLRETARKRKSLDHEVRTLMSLVRLYSEEEVLWGMKEALGARQFGARYVRFFIDKRRFASGLGEPPEPITTGNKKADSVTVRPHNLETYDALFERNQPRQAEDESGTPQTDSDDPPPA